MGGAIAALDEGFQVMEINESAYNHHREVESGKRVVLGVNRFVSETPPISGLLKVDPALARRQIESLRQLRLERDNQAVDRALARLGEVARGDDNTVPAILECVENYCTLGEISNVLRGVFGEQTQMVWF